MVTVRGQSRAADGKIPHRQPDQAGDGTALYERQLGSPRGRLRLVRAPDDLNAVIAEVPPERGTLLVFKNDPQAWHGFRTVFGSPPSHSVELGDGTRPWCAASKRAIESARFSSGWEVAAHEREGALMPLNIETFSNAVGGNAFYKADHASLGGGNRRGRCWRS